MLNKYVKLKAYYFNLKIKLKTGFWDSTLLFCPFIMIFFSWKVNSDVFVLQLFNIFFYLRHMIIIKCRMSSDFNLFYKISITFLPLSSKWGVSLLLLSHPIDWESDSDSCSPQISEFVSFSIICFNRDGLFSFEKWTRLETIILLKICFLWSSSTCWGLQKTEFIYKFCCWSRWNWMAWSNHSWSLMINKRMYIYSLCFANNTCFLSSSTNC